MNMLVSVAAVLLCICAPTRCDSQASATGEGGLAVGGDMRLVRLDQYAEAKCLDGSKAGYYYRAGKDG